MDDIATMLLLIMGACAVAVAAIGFGRRSHERIHVPIIHRRNELRDELCELLGDEAGASLLRETAIREGRPASAIEVLEKAVERAKERARQGRSAAAPAQILRL